MSFTESDMQGMELCSHGERRKNCEKCNASISYKPSDRKFRKAKIAIVCTHGDGRSNCPDCERDLQNRLASQRTNLESKNENFRPRMNAWEADYEIELKARLHSGEIIWYGFEAITLRLADRTTYTPDFVVMYPDRSIEVVEIKGFLREDANVKFKVAAELFPFVFLMLRKKKVSEGGGWEYMRSLDGYRKFANAK